MKAFYSFFDGVGDFITSRALVIILLVPFMWYRYYEFDTLFVQWLPIEDIDKKATAATLISLVFVSITLIFMVNTKWLFDQVKYVNATIAFILNLFFWSLKPGASVWFVMFISAVIASMDYGLAYLFDRMWKWFKNQEVVQDLEQQIKIMHARLTQLQSREQGAINQYAEYKRQVELCTCKECKKVFASPQAVNAHKCKGR